MPARRDRIRGSRLLGRCVLGLGWGLLGVGAASAALYTVPSLQLTNRYTVMASAFIPYGLVAFAGATVIFATSSKKWVRPVAALALAGVAAQVWWAKPYWPASTPEPGSDTLTVLTMNMRCDSRGMDDLAALAERVQPDVAVVQGLWAERREALGSTWGQLLPYSTFHPMPHLPECGTFVFSQLPLRELSTPADAQPVVEVQQRGGALTLVPVDLPTPTRGVTEWLDGLAQLNETIAAHGDGPLVVVGDFNSVREHEPMRRLLGETDLRDAAEVAGAGWTPTFPSSRWHPPLIGLDHALISPGLTAGNAQTESITGQPHRALIVRIGSMQDG